MAETYDPQEHRTLVAAAGGQTWKFFSVNKLLCDMADAGIVGLTKAYEEPGGTGNIWLDLSDPEVEGGTPKAWDGVGWTTLTPQLFYEHIAGGATGFVTDAEMVAYVSSLIGNTLQAYDADLQTIGGLTPSNDDVIQRKAGAWTNRTMAQLIADLAALGTTFQPLDSDLTAIAALSTTSYGRALLALADAAALRTAAGLVIGTNVQAYDADLTTWAGLTPSANAQSLVTAANYAEMRSLLGLVIGTNVQAYDADLTTWAGLTPSANAQSLVTAANYAAMRTLLGLVIGTDVQAYDAELAALAGLTSAADKVPYFTGSGSAATADFTSAGRSMAGAANAGAQTALLSAFVGDSGSGGTKGLVPAPVTGDATKFLRGDGSFQAIPGGGDALTSNPLSQFSATTSAQLRGVLSDESGTGAAYFQGGDIGTPSAGVLTNATGLPVGGLAAIAANSVIGNATGSSAVPTAVTAAALQGLMTAMTIQVFTSSDTWSRPTGCRFIRVRLTAGGAGGAGATAASSQSCAASGGGAGGYGEGFYDVTSTSSVSVTIGAGGAGGAAANGTGTGGGVTSFGALLSANGGTGGSAMASGTGVAYVTAGAPAAAGSGGHVNAGGNSGEPGHRDSGTIFMSGRGAPSHFGGAGRGTNFAGAGAAGGAPGAGGAGAASNSATGYAGGAGAAGIVIVEEYY